MLDFSPSTRVRLHPDINYTLIDHEAVLGTENATLYGVNAVGTEIIKLLSTPRTLLDVSYQITQQFKVDLEQSLAETKQFFTLLLDKELIVVIDTPCTRLTT